MATAKDVMTPDPIVLEASATISDVVLLFTEKKIASAPVQSTTGDVPRQLTELALVRAMVLHQLQPEKYSKLAHCMDLMSDGSFVGPNDSITTVIKAMIKSPTQRILVKSEGRKILGIISPKDMMRVLLAGKSESESVQKEIGKLGEQKLET